MTDPLSTDPECVKVKDWRHKLQRAFLGKAPPTADVSDPSGFWRIVADIAGNANLRYAFQDYRGVQEYHYRCLDLLQDWQR
jgi:hypothetical protein